MFPIDFFSQPINAELATLLIASSVDEQEKQNWLKVMPLMTDDEKNLLIKNLKEELKEFVELEKMSISMLEEKVKALFSA